MKIYLKTLLFISLLATGATAAAEPTFMDVNLSYPSLSVALDPRLKPSFNSGSAIGAEMWRTVHDMPFAFGVSTLVLLGGDFGSYPLLQAGIPVYYFPWSRPSSNYALADEVVVNSSGWAPYLKLTPGFEFINLRNTNYGSIYGASSLMFVETVGVLFPGESNHWKVEISYSSTLNMTDPTSSPISVSGFLATVGYSFRLP